MYSNENLTMESCSDEQLCALAQQGDRTAEELLVERYFSVVKACSRPYFLAGGDGEDLIQEGMLGLLKAVRAFSPERGVPFEASAFLDLSEAEGVELEDGVVEWSGAIIRGVAVCPYGTDRKTTVSLKMGETNFVVRLKSKSSNNEDEEMDEEKKVSIEDQKKDDFNPREELEEMIEEFGLERGVEFFRRGISIEEAREEDHQS